MAASAKPRALVFGHSFVRRFGEFIENCQPNGLYRRDLQLFHTCEVEIFGTGGRTVDKTIRFDLDAIRSSAPDVVVLEMGSNDACEQDSDAETIASFLVALTELLISECKLQFIVVCHILPRKNPSFEEYNDRVRQINALVSEALQHIERAKSWRHRGLIYPSAEIYLADGMHLNEGGNRTLYKSYRGATLFALSQSRTYLSLHWYILMYIFLGEFLVPPLCNFVWVFLPGMRVD